MSSLFFEKEIIYEKNSLKLLLAGLLVTFNVGYAILCFLVIFPSNILAIIPEATLNIIDETFIIYIPLNLLNVLFFLLISRMSFRELGLSWKNLWQGILIFLGIWVLTELVMLIVDVAIGVSPLLSSNWTEPNAVTLTIGGLIREFFGNSLFEEVLYRGVLILQLFILFKSKNLFKFELLRWFLAILFSQIIFALVHIPSRIINYGMSAAELALNLLFILGLGTVFAITFLCTRNLIASIGVHALSNLSLAVVQHFEFTSYIFLGSALLISISIFVIRTLIQQKQKIGEKTEKDEPSFKEELSNDEFAPLRED